MLGTTAAGQRWPIRSSVSGHHCELSLNLPSCHIFLNSVLSYSLFKAMTLCLGEVTCCVGHKYDDQAKFRSPCCTFLQCQEVENSWSSSGKKANVSPNICCYTADFFPHWPGNQLYNNTTCPVLHNLLLILKRTSRRGRCDAISLICIALDTTFCNLSFQASCLYRLPIPDQCFMEAGNLSSILEA